MTFETAETANPFSAELFPRNALSDCFPKQIGAPSLSMAAIWTVVVTKPHKERAVAAELARQGCATYLPKIKTPRKREALLFPRYLFVQLEELCWHFLLTLYGVSRLFWQGQRPVHIKETIIRKIRAMEDGKGYVRLPPSRPRFTHNQNVRITVGCMTGLSGLYKGLAPRDRARVLLESLGLVSLPLRDLAV